MLEGPHLSRDPHAALDLVEDEHEVIFVANLSKLLEELGPEVVVSASPWMVSMIIAQ